MQSNRGEDSGLKERVGFGVVLLALVATATAVDFLVPGSPSSARIDGPGGTISPQVDESRSGPRRDDGARAQAGNAVDAAMHR